MTHVGTLEGLCGSSFCWISFVFCSVLYKSYIHFQGRGPVEHQQLLCQRGGWRLRVYQQALCHGTRPMFAPFSITFMMLAPLKAPQEHPDAGNTWKYAANEGLEPLFPFAPQVIGRRTSPGSSSTMWAARRTSLGPKRGSSSETPW